MKVTFEFDTDKDNFDATHLAAMQQAQDLALALWRLEQAMYHWRRTQDLVNPEVVFSTFQDVLKDLDINLDRLIK